MGDIPIVKAQFAIGDVVRHRILPFRGVIANVDPMFQNTEEYYRSIPKAFRPDKMQPFYHLLAENDGDYYSAYVSEQNLVADSSNERCEHPIVDRLFKGFEDGRYQLRHTEYH